jgi:hypothetical protein
MNVRSFSGTIIAHLISGGVGGASACWQTTSEWKGGVMWKKGSMLGFAAIFLAVSIIFLPSSWAKTAKPKIIKPCKQCHQPKENILRGKFGNISERAETFQVLIGPATWIVSFDDETSITGAPSLAAIKKNKEVAVEITEKYGTLYTSRVSVKPPAKIPEDKLIKVGALAELVAMTH